MLKAKSKIMNVSYINYNAEGDGNRATADIRIFGKKLRAAFISWTHKGQTQIEVIGVGCNGKLLGFEMTQAVQRALEVSKRGSLMDNVIDLNFGRKSVNR